MQSINGTVRRYLERTFFEEEIAGLYRYCCCPILIGGKDTATLIDGASITSVDDLHALGVLKLEACDVLKNSYIRLRYKVIN